MGRGCLLFPSCSQSPSQPLKAGPGGGERGHSSGRGTEEFKEAWFCQTPRVAKSRPIERLCTSYVLGEFCEPADSDESCWMQSPREPLLPSQRPFQAQPCHQAQGHRCPGDVLQSLNGTPLEGPGPIRDSGAWKVQGRTAASK